MGSRIEYYKYYKTSKSHVVSVIKTKKNENMGSNESTAMSYFVQKSMQKCRLWERLFGGGEGGGVVLK